MLLTLNPMTANGQYDLPAFVHLAAQYGFPGVELDIAGATKLAEATSPGAVRDIFEKANVQPAVFGLPLDWRADEAEFAEHVANLEPAAELAQALGCTRCCTWLPPAVNGDRSEFYALAVRRLRQIGDVLGNSGVRFGLEWVGPETLRNGPSAMGSTPFVWTLPATLELISDIDAKSNNVGLLVDAFHWFTTGSNVDELRQLRAEQIVHVHVNDAPDVPLAEQQDFVRLLPGDGVIDLGTFFGTLKTIGYDGPVSAEVFDSELGSLPSGESLSRTAASMKAILQQYG